MVLETPHEVEAAVEAALGPRLEEVLGLRLEEVLDKPLTPQVHLHSDRSLIMPEWVEVEAFLLMDSVTRGKQRLLLSQALEVALSPLHKLGLALRATIVGLQVPRPLPQRLDPHLPPSLARLCPLSQDSGWRCRVLPSSHPDPHNRARPDAWPLHHRCQPAL